MDGYFGTILDFEEGIFIGVRHATKVPGGYMLTDRGIVRGLCNPEHIGIFMRDGNYIEKNHPAISDDSGFENLFWTVYDHYKNERPDGTPTGRNKVVRFERLDTIRPAIFKKILVPEDDQDAEFYYRRYPGGKDGKDIFYYHCGGIGPLLRTTISSIRAEPFENEVLRLLFRHIREENLEDVKELTERKQEERRKQIMRIGKRIISVEEDQEVISDEIINEKKKLKAARQDTSAMLQMWENKLAKSIEKLQLLVEEQESLQEECEEVESLGKELAILEQIWDKKPIQLRRDLIEAIIKEIRIKFCSPRIFKVTVEWAYSSWGVQEAYFTRHSSNGHGWSVEEETQLRNLSLEGASKEDLWLAFPNRTMSAIRRRLWNMKLPVFSFSGYENLWTYEDVQFVQRLGFDLSFFEQSVTPYNLTGWS